MIDLTQTYTDEEALKLLAARHFYPLSALYMDGVGYGAKSYDSTDRFIYAGSEYLATITKEGRFRDLR